MSTRTTVSPTRQTATKLYTAGYEGLDSASFLLILRAQHIDTLIDVREVPLSRKPGFSKRALSESLERVRIEYFHYRQLGSPKPVRAQLSATKDYDRFFSEYRAHLATQVDAVKELCAMITASPQKRFCLLCFEKNAATCHRSALARAIREASGGAITEVVNL